MEQNAEVTKAVKGFKKLVDKQREINNAQLKIRRATWDMYLETVEDVGQVQSLLKDLAIDAAAWWSDRAISVSELRELVNEQRKKNDIDRKARRAEYDRQLMSITDLSQVKELLKEFLSDPTLV